jgi:hypothetical protein
MATPIAHKGALAGAKVQALTMLDLLHDAEGRGGRVGLLQERADKKTSSISRSSVRRTRRPSG